MQVNLRWIQLKQANISTEYWPLSNKSFYCVNTIIHVLYSMAACLQLPFRSRSFQPCTKSNCKYLVSVSFSSYNWLIIWNTSEKITPHFAVTFCIFLFLHTADVHSWAPCSLIRDSTHKFSGNKRSFDKFPYSRKVGMSPSSGYMV